MTTRDFTRTASEFGVMPAKFEVDPLGDIWWALEEGSELRTFTAAWNILKTKFTDFLLHLERAQKALAAPLGHSPHPIRTQTTQPSPVRPPSPAPLPPASRRHQEMTRTVFAQPRQPTPPPSPTTPLRRPQETTRLLFQVQSVLESTRSPVPTPPPTSTRLAIPPPIPWHSRLVARPPSPTTSLHRPTTPPRPRPAVPPSIPWHSRPIQQRPAIPPPIRWNLRHITRRPPPSPPLPSTSPRPETALSSSSSSPSPSPHPPAPNLARLSTPPRPVPRQTRPGPPWSRPPSK
ncbi:uncharacterized protein EI90DRAFT_3141263 [Cantharellus anzutake]|uniref:uncharacterized protein n=1 Tax=Cantharellus anzutake TaxID=1750568 RepID=UPI00190476B2|nr:uncharacterized protein EI90DRAFT_3141263 [Cantharellus anzutake]KAF8308849.1 hypothetical protein EI90DRAFT_3141263 [Cantharellus anzutake]